MAINEREVPESSLGEHLNPDLLGFETTAEVAPIGGIMGQDRALRALDFGLQVNTNGYHVYAAGQAGTGKMTAILTSLERVRSLRPTPPDWLYVYNFDDPDQPSTVSLPAGEGQRFEADTQHLVDEVRESIPRAFQSEEYAQRKAEVVREFDQRREALTQQLTDDAKREGFAIEATPVGIATVPLVEGRPMTKEEFERLPEDEKSSLQARGERLKGELELSMRRGRAIERESQERVEELDREVASNAAGPIVDALLARYADRSEVVGYLRRVRDDIPNHLDDFRQTESEGRDTALATLLRDDHLLRYRVNLFVDNSDTQGAPIVIEYQPTYYNLFGRIDYRTHLGSMVTDLTMIKSGAIHRANGGYLVLQARDALTGIFVWETLKNALKSRQARIENLGEQYSAVPTSRIRPRPLPIDVKVVLVGPPMLYYMLNALDEDFNRLFGVRADFDVDMERTPEHITQFAGFMSSLAQKESLKPFHKSAVARIIDFASREAQQKDRLSTRFLGVVKLAREANYWASQNGSGAVTAQDVDKAVREHEYRTSLLEDRLRRAILEQTVRIATDGAVAGQVNGLSVIDLGDHAFGRPARITARTSMGTHGITNIEREIDLSGRIHSKGVLTLAGYLAGKYAQERPLALSASLTFEQLYDEVEGDSASSAELYALLSSLSGLPVKQSLAVTGSVNQRGEIQAIGGVNEKIEGYYRICEARGLTGDQGVVIPQDNVKHLMLRDEVVRAVKDGKFHVWAVETVDQGIELLTGAAAGDRQSDGSYPVGTVNFLVDRQLKQFAEKLKEFGAGAGRGQAVAPRSREGGEAAKRHAHRTTRRVGL